MWVMFTVPTPTSEGRTARDLYEDRVAGITDEMRASARRHGCRFHRVWTARDGSALVVVSEWESAEGANAFYQEWDIPDEPGEVMTRLEGDLGLVAFP